MISFLRGNMVEKTPTFIVIDCNGVGYGVNISLNTYTQLPDKGELLIYTHLVVKEDSHTLFGFADKIEREVFQLLISVSGVGSNTARNVLSYITPKELMQAIANNDTRTIRTIKGIGQKTAHRLVLELQEKVIKLYDVAQQEQTLPLLPKIEEAISALEVLGFLRKSTEKVMKTIVAELPEDASVEEYIKQALKRL